MEGETCITSHIIWHPTSMLIFTICKHFFSVILFYIQLPCPTSLYVKHLLSVILFYIQLPFSPSLSVKHLFSVILFYIKLPCPSSLSVKHLFCHIILHSTSIIFILIIRKPCIISYISWHSTSIFIFPMSKTVLGRSFCLLLKKALRHRDI